MRKVVGRLAIALGVYLIGRAVIELFVIDMGDPATYRDDWGGPGLAGVLAVHCGPGIVAAILLVIVLVRWRSRRRLPSRQP